MTLSTTLNLTMATVLRSSDPARKSVLRCSPELATLVDFSGIELFISGLQMQDCAGPGIRVARSSSASISIVDSVFLNFARVLEPGRVNISAPGSPAPVSESTAALVLHAVDFSGQLTVRSTVFADNAFTLPEEAAATSRRLTEASGNVPRPDSQATLQDAERGASVGPTLWELFNALQRRELAEDSPGYSMDLLQRAKLIHPGVETGPWADDQEAVIAVTCSGQTPCTVTFEDVTMSNNTDFMELAGGNGAWSEGAPRHSADVSLTGVRLEDHISGWPAVWLRWPRSVVVKECEVTRSTGAMWFDEVRDVANITDSAFHGNELNQLWRSPETCLTGERPLYVQHTSSVAVADCRFIDNDNGGVYFEMLVTASVTDSTFQGNTLTYDLGEGAADNSYGGAGLVAVNVSTVAISTSNFTNNTAVVGGGAAYFRVLDQLTVSGCRFESNAAKTFDGGALWIDTAISARVLRSAFLGNSAGAIFSYNSPLQLSYSVISRNKVIISNARFVLNNASVAPLQSNYTALYGREKDYAAAKVKPCYNGGGGAVCAVGLTGKNIQINFSDMVLNIAKDGGALYLAEGIGCVEAAGCYKVNLSFVNMTGNKAASRGGGVFWMHEGLLNVATCPSDVNMTYSTNGTALLDSTANVEGSVLPYAITLTLPGRKGPAYWYGQLSGSNRLKLLSPVNGPVIASTNAVHMVNGTLVITAGSVFVNSMQPGATVVSAEGVLLTAFGSTLSGGGVLTAPPEGGVVSVAPNDFILEAGAPVVVNGSVPRRIDFYTSNTDIKIAVTVHDWYGHNCTGDETTQPLVIVTAASTEVSGGLAIPAVNGVAEYSTMRLRAKEGLHTVAMTGQLYAPLREMLDDQVQIYVRPCAINEFISPKNLDECIPCDSGAYNFNVSAVTCQQCPDNAVCSYPDPFACKTGDDCEPQGFMVPEDGYWHSSFFSEQVMECPNELSCTVANRSDQLAAIQLEIWKAAREIQLNTSNAVADKAALEVIANIVANMPSRRLLQVKAISDEQDVVMILLASIQYLPAYMLTQCSEGYTGTLCGECLPGYGWSRVATCVKCPSRVLNNFYYALVTILTLSVLAFTIYSSLKEQQKGTGALIAGPRQGPRRNVTFAQTYDNAAAENPQGSEQVYDPAVDGRAILLGSPDGNEEYVREASIDEDFLAGGADHAHANPLYDRNSRFSRVLNSVSSPEIEPMPSDPEPVGEATEHAHANPLYDGSNGQIHMSAHMSPHMSPHAQRIAVDSGIGSGYGNSEMEPQMGVPMMQSVPMMQEVPEDAPIHQQVAPTRSIGRGQGSRRRHDSLRNRRAHQSTVVKIFVSYVQVLALLQNVPLDIPHVMDVYYRINNQAISYPGLLVSLDCSLPESGVSKAYVRIILSALAPLYIFVGAVIYFIVYDIIDYYIIMPYNQKQINNPNNKKKKKKKGPLRHDTFRLYLQDYMPRQMIVTFVTIFFFFYPSVVQSLMTIFKCKEVDLPSENPLASGLGLVTDSVWSQDFGQSCYKGSHMGLAMGLGVPGVVLIAIGWPIISALLMTHKLPGMKRIKFTESMTSFFLADFKKDYVWWESVVMLRKLAIAAIVTFVDGSTSAGVQLLLVVCIIAMAMGVHLMSMPYEHTYTNNLELTSLATLLFTLYFSLYFSFSGSITDGGRVAISIIILVINICMVLVFIGYIVQAYWQAILKGIGFADLDFESRRKLTTAELRERISAARGLDVQGGGAQEGHHGWDDFRTSYGLRMVNVLTTAVYAGTRVGSTTSKMIMRVRTLVGNDPNHLRNLPHRESSVSGAEGEETDRGTGSAAEQSQERASSSELGASSHPDAERPTANGVSKGKVEKGDEAESKPMANGANGTNPRSGATLVKRNSAPKMRTHTQDEKTTRPPAPTKSASSSNLDFGNPQLPAPPRESPATSQPGELAEAQSAPKADLLLTKAQWQPEAVKPPQAAAQVVQTPASVKAAPTAGPAVGSSPGGATSPRPAVSPNARQHRLAVATMPSMRRNELQAPPAAEVDTERAD
ncbi:hypothetical protein GPECTOR_3g310 [Gonium pectorale]|uniref:TRP C-terminal domain-containing protein n=1 Tax=Gonium pectorale TaxID=33097 RepID=A0A150GZH8_GONPE|nr:hypothetical protein GPECTOR_3g310 [Gonium pectorale]|eukprot:KXZ55163.1 hypothetical protein GPECTOR_3g310 [Gonium pectorale]